METKLSNATPLGLMGFGMTAVLMGLHNAGFFGLSTMILAMAIFYGGIAQIVAGLMEFKRGNTFFTTAFISYGLFWLTMVYLWVRVGNVVSTEPTNSAMATYMFLWALFTFFMWLGTFGRNKLLQLVFFTFFAVFCMNALAHIADNMMLMKLAGWVGVVSGFSAIYYAMAKIVNEQRGREILPMGSKA